MPFARYFCIFINVGFRCVRRHTDMKIHRMDKRAGTWFIQRFNQAIALVKAVISHHISRDGRAKSDFPQVFGIGFVAVRVFMCFHTATGSRTFFFNLKRHAAK